MPDIIIIGGGPAGLAAGLYTARAGLSVLLLEAGFAGGQAATTNQIENYPGFAQGIGGPELAMEMEKQAVGAGLSLRYSRVEAIELQGQVKRVLTEGQWLEAPAVILCMGAQPKRTQVPGEEAFSGRGVSWCATCDGAFYRGKKVAVLGGGNTAAEEALYLANLCEQVTLIHRRDSLRAERALAERLAKNPRVRFLWDSTVQAFEGDSRLRTLRVLNVKNQREEQLPVDAAFVAIGKQPDTALVSGQLALDEFGYVLAGEDTRSSLPLVYAAGDLRHKPLRQVVTAVADGAVAAMMAAHDLGR